LASVTGSIFIPYSISGYAMYQGLNLALPLAALKLRREAESAADFYGLQYLYKSGYDPEYFIRFLERTWPQTPAAKNMSKAFSPFPPFPERLETMNKEIATILPPRGDAIVSSPEFQEAKERLSARESQLPLKLEENHQKPTLRKRTDGQPTEPPSQTPDCD
jgi:predicted Zn-dependent protease